MAKTFGTDIEMMGNTVGGAGTVEAGNLTLTSDYIKRNANTHGVWLYDNGTSIVYPSGVSGEFTIQSGTLGGANTTRFKIDDTGAYLPQVSGMNSAKIMSMDATTGVVEVGSLVASDVGAAASNHTHGNISNAGAVGGTQYLPIITGAGGVLVTGEFSNAANTFAEGNHLHTGVYQPAGSYQPLDATLTAIAGVTTAADTLIYFNDVDTALSTSITATARSILDDTSTSAVRTTIGAPPTSHASTGSSYGYSTGITAGHCRMSTVVPSADSGTGSAGTVAAIPLAANADHVHPLSTAYAAAVHTHVAANVTDFNSAAISATSATYLPLAGGTMTGGVVMGSNPITDASLVSGNTTGNDWSLGGGALSLKAGSGAILPILLQPVTGSFGSEPKLSWRGTGGGDQSLRGNPTGIELTGTVTCTNSITDKVSPSTTVASTPSLEFGLVASSVGALKIKNDVGEVRIAQASAAYAYYETNATNHYFNKPLEVNSNVAINSATVTITPASGMTTTSMSAYKGCDKTLIVGGIITKSSNFTAGDTLFTLASGGYPPFTTYVTVATSATAVVTLTISTAGVVTLSTIHHGTVGAGMTLSFQTIRA